MVIKWISVVLISLLLTSCAVTNTTQSGLVGVDRKQTFLVSQNQMIEGGQQAYSQVLAEAKQAGKLNTDKAIYARLQTILTNMIPHTAHFRKDAVNWDWEVNLIEEDTINAWIMPGGKIMFYTGLINQLKLNDDEIAAIMGHEMAHDLREHARERVSQAAATQLGLSIVGQLTGAQAVTLDIAGALLNVGILLPYSRVHEVEADRIGIELAAMAGYDPSAAIDIWNRMAELSKGNQPPEFLSTHPSYDSRIKDLTKYSTRLMPVYQEARAARLKQ
ncbi:M48 family metallopeptidase [Thiomicrospira microaerophila]|uniref:M48 family metallopeptidase n=1 Tax=Thiomicrospira microaerophila TaxID=406020 RepID=UPI00200C6125|nr:M48 family metallopeptidase [Thiomicrospira microaerophila]UQB42290.1 M48 family metallopeptidase [Thiomicrospira microaerophila]